MKGKDNDVRVMVNGRIKYIPVHLANNASFCKENGITRVSQPPKEVSVFDESKVVVEKSSTSEGTPSSLSKDLHWKKASEMAADFQTVEDLEAWINGEERKSVLTAATNRINDLQDAN